MNLVNGVLISEEKCEEVLESLEEELFKTLAKKPLDIEKVIESCHELVGSNFIEKLLKEKLEFEPKMVDNYLGEIKNFFSRDGLYERMEMELGVDFLENRKFLPKFRREEVTQKIMPLGVLFHITAGNSGGLPVFSVLEGLLTGNINIIKLPREEGGLTVLILQELFKIMPELCEYVYVFDYSSKDVEAIGKLGDLADGVVVWGSDEAVLAVRKMLKPNTKIIEWGHKLSFAYFTVGGINDFAMEGLAKHICQTNQLLCSSCQGIFIDTSDMEVVRNFCERFVKILQGVSESYVNEIDVSLQAQISIKLRSLKLEEIHNKSETFREENCSVTMFNDDMLESSMMFKNCWVKGLSRGKIVSVLRKYKNYLQTVGLSSVEEERESISEEFFKTGVVRVCECENMSENYFGLPHDGEYSLRRYVKVVSFG